MKKIKIDRKILFDLTKRIENIRDRMESLEFMSDPKIMEAHRKAREQIRNREFVSWKEMIKDL